ncbi:hypothetical protein M378DRAFT_918536 [Amanita muscaria Koide BX008]|uniref:Uncharacterized protein n=1 Tax=Amanita muscaria (strain Koide BX008) TaxID=946122 RepID=A0A0C2WUN3_AMAMK|nr:hypothetical protein M378DRAFT_918536 [Amanita muscaria Koide BX008]
MALFLAVLTLITTVSALGEADCTVSQYRWTFNSGGSTPCRVAEQLFLPCNTSLTIGPLNSNQFYRGMIPDMNYPCWCNSVFYSLLSACAICQGALLDHWSDFSKGCPRRWMTKYPLTIPARVRVPHWAYLDVQASDVFDPAAAASAVGSESTSPAQGSTTSSAGSSIVTSSIVSPLPASTTASVLSTSSIISNSATLVSSTTSITSSITPTASASSASPSVASSQSGASRRTVIAAGVAGGIVTLGLIAGLFFCHRRRSIKASRKLMTTPYTYTGETPSETRKKPYDPHNDARYLELKELNQSTAGQPSRKRVHVPLDVLNIGKSPSRF